MLITLSLVPNILSEPQHTNAFDRVLRSMFPSAKPKVVAEAKKPKRSRKKSATSEATADPFHITVEPEWLAQYWEQEALWDYYIPEDSQIKFSNGKYVVPIVVYRHNEDMLNTHRRTVDQH